MIISYGSTSSFMSTTSQNFPGLRRQPRQARSRARVQRILEVAEEMFVADGYDVTTTNAIAAAADVPIGSLYQFFPDKSVIVQALAAQYMEKLHQRFETLHESEAAELSLPAYVERVIDMTNQFFNDHPGYHSIFMQVQNRIPELEAIEEAADNQLIQEIAALLSSRCNSVEQINCETISFVIVKAIGTLLWLALSQEQPFRDKLLIETKRMTLSYLQSYFSP